MIICKDRAILLFLLLIIYLDEARAEQNWKTSKTEKCAKPQPVSNAVLREEYEEGDKVEYICQLGYKVEGTRERWCRKTKWTDVRFTCNPILCPPLPQIQHGSIFQDTSDGVANNYTCEFGYILNGDAQIRIVERTCQSDGTWSGHEPTCQATPCPTFSRTQHGSLSKDTYKDRFANYYENIAANTYDKGMCVKQVEREIVLLAKSGKRPVFELLHYACNLNKANYAVRVRIYNVSNDFDSNVKLARGTVMASLNQGQERLTQGDDMRFFSKFQELEEGKTYIIIGKDGYRTFDDRHLLLYPIMGTTLIMKYISPQQFRINRRKYRTLYTVQSNFERLMLTRGCQNK